MSDTIDVDDILRGLGKYKRHTIQQIIYNYFICVFLIGFPMLVYVFVGKYTWYMHDPSALGAFTFIDILVN